MVLRKVFLSILLFIHIFSNAYPPNTKITRLINLLNESKTTPIERIIDLFKLCATKNECDNLYKKIILEITKEDVIAHVQIQYAKAINSFGAQIESMEILKNIPNHLSYDNNSIQLAYNLVLGDMIISSENPIMAITYFNKSLKIANKLNDSYGKVKSLTKIGLSYTIVKNLDSAFYYYNLANLEDKGESIRNTLYLKLNLAWANCLAGELELSKSIFKDALPFFNKVTDYSALIRTYGNIADIYLNQDSLDLAKEYYQKGINTASIHGFQFDIYRFNRAIADLLVKKKDFEKANIHYKKSDSIRANFKREEIINETIYLERDYQKKTEKKRAEIDNQKINFEQRKNSILISLLFLAVILTLVLSFYFFILKRKNLALLALIVEKDEKDEGKSINSSIINDSEMLKLINSLEELIITKEFYKDENITLERLAKKLKTNRTYLSESINTYYNLSFSRWLNEIRIKESRKLLRSEKFDKYSIEGISKTVGFNTISSFNSNFKSITGITPSFYRNNRSNH